MQVCYIIVEVIYLQEFFHGHYFRRHFPPKEDPGLLTVGYDDFHIAKSLTIFRMQKFYTLHYVLSGKGYLEIYGRIFSVNSGQMFFIAPDTQMRYYPDINDPWEYVWFSMVGSSATEYGVLLGFSEKKPVIQVPNPSKVELTLKRLLSSLEYDGGGYFAALSAFYELLDLCTSHTMCTGIEDIKRSIDDSFTLPSFQISQLCTANGISHSHLLRLFKKSYGTTLLKYLNAKRIDYACQLLLTTTMSVSSIAFSCGFSDAFHFMKAFKKATGMSALSYRKSGRKIHDLDACQHDR